MNHQNDSPLITTTEESAIRIDSTISLRGSQKPIRIECSNTSAASRPGSSGRHRRLGPRPTRVLGRDFMIVVAQSWGRCTSTWVRDEVTGHATKGRSGLFSGPCLPCVVFYPSSQRPALCGGVFFCVEWKPRRMRKAMEPCNCGEEPLTKLACIETQRL